MGAEEARVSDICIRRARVVVAWMDVRREATDLAGLRSAVPRRSYWDDHIAVGRIQLALNVKVVALRNLGNEKCEIIYDELQDGVIDFAPYSFVVLRRDGSYYELTTEGSGAEFVPIHRNPRRDKMPIGPNGILRFH